MMASLAVSLAGLLGAAAPALAAGNLAAKGTELPELKMDTSTDTFSQTEYDLETGKFYFLNISADDGADNLAFMAPEFFRNVWVDQFVVNDLEIKTQDPYSLEFDNAGTFRISFVPIRPGVYEFYSPGYEDKGFKGKFVVK
jgi:hypothetical protein